MSSSESVKQALIKQILLESNTANARQLIEVSLLLSYLASHSTANS